MMPLNQRVLFLITAQKMQPLMEVQRSRIIQAVHKSRITPQKQPMEAQRLIKELSQPTEVLRLLKELSQPMEVLRLLKVLNQPMEVLR